MKSKHRILLAACAAIALAPAPALAQPNERIRYDIQSRDLGTALTELARQSNREIYFSADLTRGRRAPRISEQLTIEQALERLLNGSGLTYRLNASGAIVVSPVSGEAEAGGAAADEAGAEILVTGTLIRGVNPTAPVDTYTREEIERTGVSTIEQFARRVPQNHSDNTQEAQNGIIAGIRSADGTSFTQGTSFNLRGVGPGQTLTLVNGRRTSGAGQGGSFVDVSLFPLSAIDRIEILTDGASALYGSDAIGGVVNLVLRRDLRGAETSLRAGYATDGDGEEMAAAQSLGLSWAGGGAFVAFEHRETEPILTRNRSFLPDGLDFTLVPEENSDKALATVRQQLGSSMTLTVMGQYAERDTGFASELAIFSQNVSRALSARSYGGSAGLEIALGREWSLDLGAGYSRVDETFLARTVTPAFQRTVTSDTQNRLVSVDAKLDGPLFALPGGDVRGALYAEFRDHRYDRRDTTNGNVGLTASIGRQVAAVAGELFVPLLSPDNGAAGAHRLDLSLAARFDHYDDFGSTLNPRVGLRWSPVPGLELRATWSTAFHAPALSLVAPRVTYSVFNLPDPSSPTGQTLSLVDDSVGTLVLEPETAETFSAGFDFEPLPHLRLSATYYRIRYEDRISRPPFPGGSFFNAFQAGGEATQFLITRNPPLAQVQGYYNCSGCIFSNSGNQPATAIRAIIDARTLNLSETVTDGIDASLRYSTGTGLGTLSGALNLVYTFTNLYTVIEGRDPVELLNRLAQPVDFRATGNIGWSSGRFSATLTLNYVDSYRNDEVGGRVGSWTTADLYAGYRTPDGFSVSLAVQNLTDARPPFVQRTVLPFPQATYDGANASAVGRFVSIQLRKQW